MKILKKLLIALLIILVMLFVLFLFFRVPDKSIAELKNSYANHESEYVLIDDTEVHYRREGQGAQKVLLIHGTAASLHTWDVWTSILQDSMEVIRLDLPGFGLTGSVDGADYQMDFYTDYIRAFITKIGVEKFSIVGNSLGGEIAWNYALKYPNQLDKMILIDAAGYPNKDVPTIFKLIRNPILSPIIKQVTPKSLVEKNIKEVYTDDSKITQALIDRYYDLQLRAGNRDALIIRAKTYAQRSPEKIRDITTPTLIQWGEDDLWIPLDRAYKFTEYIQDSKLITYPNAGHVPMEEIPVKTAHDAMDFLLS